MPTGHLPDVHVRGQHRGDNSHLHVGPGGQLQQHTQRDDGPAGRRARRCLPHEVRLPQAGPHIQVEDCAHELLHPRRRSP